MTRLQEVALAIVCALAGALVCAFLFGACSDPPDQTTIPETEYVR